MLQGLDPFHFVLIAVTGWMNQREYQIIDYLREKNRVLREQLGERRLRLNDDQRRRLAVKAKGLTPTASGRNEPHCHVGNFIGLASEADRADTMAGASADQDDRARRQRSKRWCCEWLK